MEQDILKFISLIRNTASKEIVRIFTCGGCYRFYLILKTAFPEAEPYMITDDNENVEHIVSKIGNNFYDIRGKFEEVKGLHIMREKDIKLAETFKYPVIQKSEIEIRKKSIKRKKLSMYTWYIGNLFLYLSIFIRGIEVKKITGPFISLMLSYVCITVLTRIIIKVFITDESNYCRFCGERLN